MKIFVTVGTTKFNSLVNACDELAGKGYDFVIQHADKDLHLKNAEGDVFYKNVVEQYSAANVVITHAGAGSIYRLLELGKRIIVVPNLERIDRHQSDIAKYVESNGYGLVCWSMSELESKLNEVKIVELKKYEKIGFSKFEEIKELIQEL